MASIFKVNESILLVFSADWRARDPGSLALEIFLMKLDVQLPLCDPVLGQNAKTSFLTFAFWFELEDA